MKIKIKKNRDDAVIPEYARKGDSGFDFTVLEDIAIQPNEVKKVPTGLSFAIPEGYELQLRLRSNAAKKLLIPNAPGTVDSGYRGEVCYLLRNLSDDTVVIEKGKSVAQEVICPVIRADLELCDDLPVSERGSGGFGSTGGKID